MLYFSRCDTWAMVILHMPSRMSRDVQSMNSTKKCTLLLSCYGGSYIPEWTSLYVKTLIFIRTMYMARAAIYKDIEESHPD